jgi:hypothetical protein
MTPQQIVAEANKKALSFLGKNVMDSEGNTFNVFQREVSSDLLMFDGYSLRGQGGTKGSDSHDLILMTLVN